MSPEISFLVSALYNHQLVEYAVKFKCDLPADVTENYNEPKNREIIWNMLPPHLRTLGPIINLRPIFDVQVIK